MSVNVHDAKTNFSKLLARVAAGERIVIARAGKPVAILGPVDEPAPRKPGRDRIVIRADFDEPLDDFDPANVTASDPLAKSVE